MYLLELRCSKHLSKTSLSLQAGPFSSSFQRNEYHNAKLHTQTTISNFHQAIQLKCPNTLAARHLCHVHLKPFPAPRCQNQLRGAKSPSAPKGKGQAATRHQSYHALVLPKRLMRPANDLDCQHMSHSMDTNTIYMAIYGCYPGGGCALTITGRPSSDSRIAWAKVASQILTCAFDAGRRISVQPRQVGQKGVRRRGKTTSIPRHAFLQLCLSGAREKESEEGEPKKQATFSIILNEES